MADRKNPPPPPPSRAGKLTLLAVGLVVLAYVLTIAFGLANGQGR